MYRVLTWHVDQHVSQPRSLHQLAVESSYSVVFTSRSVGQPSFLGEHRSQRRVFRQIAKHGAVLYVMACDPEHQNLRTSTTDRVGGQSIPRASSPMTLDCGARPSLTQIRSVEAKNNPATTYQHTMKFNTKQAFSSACPNTFVRDNTSIPTDRLEETPDEGRHLRYDAALVVTPILTSARRTEGLTSANVDELSCLMRRLQLESPQREAVSEADSEEEEERSVGSETTVTEEPVFGRVECTVYDRKQRQNRSVLRSSRLLGYKSD